MQIIFLLYIFIIGLCFGSFANVIIFRLPRNISIVKPPSHCPSCDRHLKVVDLIPVFSFIFLKGRCRYCNKKISVRYPVIETACGLLFWVMALHVGVSLTLVPLCLLALILLCVSLIDADTQEIPDGLLITGAVAAVAWVALFALYPRWFVQLYPVFNGSAGSVISAPAWYDALIGAAAGAAPLFIIDRITLLTIKKDGFGFGDVKLMAMAGLFIGWKLILVSFLFAFITGGAYAAFLLFTRRADKGSYLAFGPFLSAGVILALLFGNQFISFLLL